MPLPNHVLAVVLVAMLPSVVRAQSTGWTPEVAIGPGLGHVFRWEDQTFGDPVTAGGGVAVAHASGWAFEVHGGRTFGLEPVGDHGRALAGGPWLSRQNLAITRITAHVTHAFVKRS